MAPTRRSRLEEAAIALLALLTAVGSAVDWLVGRKRSDPDSLEQDRAKPNSAARAIPVP